MNRKGWIAIAVGCGIVGIVLVLLAVAAGGTLWLWLTGDGSLKRAKGQYEISLRLSVTILSKEFQGGHAGHRIHFTVQLENLGDEVITQFDGTVLLTDNNGWTTFSCGSSEKLRLTPHAKIRKDWMLECETHDPSHGKWQDAKPGEMDATWIDKNLTLEDGTNFQAAP